MANGRVDSWDEDDAPAPRPAPAVPPVRAAVPAPAPPADPADPADSLEAADDPPTSIFPTRAQWRAAPPWVLLISCLSLGSICVMAMVVLLLIVTLR